MLVSLVATAMPSPVRGKRRVQHTDPRARVEWLNRQAMSAYDNLELEVAETRLTEAIEIAKGFSDLPASLLARTYVNLGLVWGAGFGDVERAESHFLTALRLDPDVELDTLRATPPVQEAFAAANASVARDTAAQAASQSVSTQQEPPPEDRGGATHEARSPTRFMVGVMVGTGLGVVLGGETEGSHPRVDGDPAPVEVASGMAWAPFHIVAELGYALTPSWHLMAAARVQLVNAVKGAGTRGRISVLGLVRAQRLFGEGMLRYFASFGAGAGTVRHRVSLGDYDSIPATPDSVADSRTAGIGAVTGGGGVIVVLHRHFSIVAELVGLVLFPDVAAHVDVNTGLRVSF